MHKLIKLLIITTLSTSLICFSTRTSLCSGNNTLFFYNPEININNFASLKMELDTYFSEYGNYRFQPFSKMDTFETFVFTKKSGLLLVSSWHYKILKSKLDLVPLLVGVSKGLSTYRKILIVNENVNEVEGLRGKTIASSGSEEYTKSTLQKMLGRKYPDIVESIKILVVPKDIDTLMVLGFGMVQAALTSDKSFNKLEKISANLFKKLKKVSISNELLLPVVAAFKNFSEKDKELVEIIASMDKSSQGSRDLKMIGLDGWKPFTPVEKKILESEY